MDRLETWEHAIKALEDHFTSGEFEPGEYEIAHNGPVGTISIIHRPTQKVMEFTDTTGSHYKMDSWNIIMPTGELLDRLHGHRWKASAEKGGD